MRAGRLDAPPNEGDNVRFLTWVKARLYRFLGIVSPSGAYPTPKTAGHKRGRDAVEGFNDGWASSVAAGPLGRCDGDPFDSRPCAFACCPSTAGLASEYPEAFNGRQTGGETSC